MWPYCIAHSISLLLWLNSHHKHTVFLLFMFIIQKTSDNLSSKHLFAPEHAKPDISEEGTRYDGIADQVFGNDNHHHASNCVTIAVYRGLLSLLFSNRYRYSDAL